MPSRDNKARTAAPAAVSPAPPGGRRPGAAEAEDPRPHRQAPSGRGLSRRSLKNWRVRSRLLLLIIIPTLTAVVLGGSRIVTSVQSALGYQRVEQLANMSYDVTGLAARLEYERDQTLEYIGEGTAGRAGTLSRQHGRRRPAEPPGRRAGAEPDHAVDQEGPGGRRCRSAPATPRRCSPTRRTSATCSSCSAPLRTAATTTQLPATQVLSPVRLDDRRAAGHRRQHRAGQR